MKNNKTQKTTQLLKLLFLSCVTLIFYTSCACFSINPNYTSKNKIPYESIIFIEKKGNINLEICEEVTENNEKKEVCEKQQVSLNHYGSGYIFSNYKNGSYVGTAGHVCDLLPPEELIMAQLFFGATISDEEINVYDIEGNKLPGNILKIDNINDICVIKVEKLKRHSIPLANLAPFSPLELSKKNVKVAPKYYSIGFPRANYSKNFSVIAEGTYMGNRKYNNVNYDFYTIYAEPGSSGSVVLNERNEIIGMITMSSAKMHHFSLGPTFKIFKNFLIKTLQEDLNKKNIDK